MEQNSNLQFEAQTRAQSVSARKLFFPAVLRNRCRCGHRDSQFGICFMLCNFAGREFELDVTGYLESKNVLVTARREVEQWERKVWEKRWPKF